MSRVHKANFLSTVLYFKLDLEIKLARYNLFFSVGFIIYWKSFSNDWLFLPGLSDGRRWRGRWTGFAGLTGSTHVSTAGWSLGWAGSRPPVSCWVTKVSLPSPLSVVWTCRGPLSLYWSNETTWLRKHEENKVCKKFVPFWVDEIMF